MSSREATPHFPAVPQILTRKAIWGAWLVALVVLLPTTSTSFSGEGSAPPQGAEDAARYLFTWRGVPVGMVTLRRAPGRFTYHSLHLHTRDGHVGARTREVT